jgi:predicted ferric reductase
MKNTTKTYFWLVVYGFMVLGPLILLIVMPGQPQRTFWRDFSVALGFGALSLLGLQFVLSARSPLIGTVFPLDALYYFHHRISLITWALALAHPLILFINNPYTLRLLNIFQAPWRARAAVVALLAMTVLVISSVWRKPLRFEYEPWRGLHAVAAILAAGLALYHMFKVGYYSSTPWQQGIWIALAVLWLGMQIYVRLVKPILLLQHPYELQEAIEERGKSWTLVLKPKGHDGINFNAGQVAWLTIGTSPFALRKHPFSMTSSAEQSEHLTFTIRELGDFTSQIGQFSPGERAYIDGPYGTFDLDHHEASAYVLIAGGIGIAPMMSIMRTMADRGDSRPMILFYGSPTWDDVILREEVEQLEDELNLDVVHILEHPPEGWEGEVGYITADVLDRHLPEDRQRWTYFICGPLPMINAVESALETLAIPKKRMYIEEYEMA